MNHSFWWNRIGNRELEEQLLSLFICRDSPVLYPPTKIHRNERTQIHVKYKGPDLTKVLSIRLDRTSVKPWVAALDSFPPSVVHLPPFASSDTKAHFKPSEHQTLCISAPAAHSAQLACSDSVGLACGMANNGLYSLPQRIHILVPSNRTMHACMQRNRCRNSRPCHTML